MKKHLTTGLILLVSLSINIPVARAVTSRVSSVKALVAEISVAKPGTTILLENGSYQFDGPVDVACQGLPGQPVVLTAATPGGVEIRGAGGFVVRSEASWVTIRGFRFLHDSGKEKIEAGATHCRFTGNLFECAGKGAYLAVSGDDCEIDHNTFRNKSTEGQMISVQGPGSSGMAQRTWIHHNLFSNFVPVSNNCSSIQVGLSGRSLSAAHTLVEYNLFVDTRGENENICNKSCENVYRYNTFGKGSSELSLRHGNKCEVYGNFFIASEGIRFYGHLHQVYSNYFEGCNPAINIGNGDGIVPRDKLTSHDKPDSVFVVYNTLYNNMRNVIMQGRNNGLGASNIFVANNIIVGGGEAFRIDGTIEHPVWGGNIVWKTSSPGNIPANGYLVKDPGLDTAGAEKFRLSGKTTETNTATGEYPFATTDIDGGQTGPGRKAGADQDGRGGKGNHILTEKEVGAGYL